MKTTIQKLTKYPAVLRLFLGYPNRNFTPLEISRITKLAYATTWRFIHDLERAGVITIEKIGGYNVCRLNQKSPIIDELRDFVELELSPHRLAVSKFVDRVKKLKHVKKVILFGSVAKGKETLTSDIDVALLVDDGDLLEKKIVEVADEVVEETKMKIIPIVLTQRELKENEQFASELAEGVVLYERAKRG
ncbi:MAG: nucleotidyltransferase domain-containing protein [Methanocellales archaeon]|nr:nucleotidyltransferase domain-containing protein [Methanocellales archaeon]